MKNFLTTLFILCCLSAFGQNGAPVISKTQSPAEVQISAAQKMISEQPGNAGGYERLANSLIRRARETSDPVYYSQAQAAITKSLVLAPNDFEAAKTQVSILLGNHDFAAALSSAKALNQQVPDDVMVYGLLTDANVALGNYSDAEKSAQWMLKLRPGNLPALTHAANLRNLFGDPEGAVELMEIAIQSTPSTETEERAWLFTETARFKLQAGKVSEADALLQQAIFTFPDYPYALEELAKAKIAERKYDEAIKILNSRVYAVEDSADLYDLARAIELAERPNDAKPVFARFETAARAEVNLLNNCNLELIFYYADHKHDFSAALALAQKEAAQRHDVYTLDAYAWALHVNGKEGEARKQIEAALTVGIRDSSVFRHAGEIALKAGDRQAAKRYLQASVDLDPACSEETKLILSRLM